MTLFRTIIRASPSLSARQSFSRKASLPSGLFSRLCIAKMSSLPRLEVFEAIAAHDPKATAVIHSLSGRRFTYGDVIQDVGEARTKLEKIANGSSLSGERIAFLVENSYDYVGELILLSMKPFIDLTERSHFVIYPGNRCDCIAFSTSFSC